MIKLFILYPIFLWNNTDLFDIFNVLQCHLCSSKCSVESTAAGSWYQYISSYLPTHLQRSHLLIVLQWESHLQLCTTKIWQYYLIFIWSPKNPEPFSMVQTKKNNLLIHSTEMVNGKYDAAIIMINKMYYYLNKNWVIAN